MYLTPYISGNQKLSSESAYDSILSLKNKFPDKKIELQVRFDPGQSAGHEFADPWSYVFAADPLKENAKDPATIVPYPENWIDKNLNDQKIAGFFEFFGNYLDKDISAIQFWQYMPWTEANWLRDPKTLHAQAWQSVVIAMGALNWNQEAEKMIGTYLTNEWGFSKLHFGSVSDDLLSGSSVSDKFFGSGGIDKMDGGAGIDTVVYSGNRSNYTLTKSASSYTVTDKTGSDGTDTLTNIERLVFSDFKEALGTTALNESEVQKLYIAYFNRPGDPGGLGYWEGLLANGASMTMLQNSFSSSAEYQAIYIGQQNTVLITKLYQNLFGRVVDVNDGGVQWWAGEMAAGRHTITTIAGALSSGTTPGSADNIAITNKIAAATAFTNALNTNAETENYVGAAAFAIASNWLAPIRDDNILATSLASRDATIASAVAAKTVLVNATGTANASQGVVTFELAAASFDYTISGFGVGDRIDFPTGAAPTLTNANYSDGQVNLMWSAGGNNVLIKLVGLSGTQDSQLNTLADFNTVFGIGSVY